MKKLIILALLVLGAGLLYSIVSQKNDSEENSGNPTPTLPETGGIPQDWSTYSSDELRYSVSYPSEYEIEENGEYSILLVNPSDTPSVDPANFIYISVVTPEMRESSGEVYNYNRDQFEKLVALENVGDSVNLAEDMPEMEEWFTYTVVGIEDIDTGKAKNFENRKPWEFPSGTTENRYIYGTESNIYILGYYTGGDSVSESSQIDPSVAHDVIKSFSVTR